jgi:hypothetical protein
MGKLSAILLLGIVGVFVPSFYFVSDAQVQPVEFSCVGATSGAACPDGTVSLRGFSSTSAPAPYNYVSVAGFLSAGDGGGGTYFRLGSTAGSSPKCTFYSSNTGSITVDKYTVTGLSGITRKVVVGESVSNGTGMTGIPPGAEVASIDTSGGTINMTLPATATSVGTVNITGDNGGTLILDNVAGNQDCYQKTNYHGDPHEFGAVGDGVADDTVPLENWFGAYGSVNPTFNPATMPPNFGPWNASVPANYLVTAPLLCPENALIQGLATQISGTDNGGAPVVRIFAARQTNNMGAEFPPVAGTAVLGMGDYCRLSGVTIDAGGLQMSGTTNGTTGLSSAIVTNLDAALIKQVQLNDIVTAGDIPAGTTVTGVSASATSSWGTACYPTYPAPCVTLSASIAVSHSELISFNGPSGVAIGGKRDTIDGHSLIENGFNNVFCINTSDAQPGLQLKDAQFARSGADNLALGGCPNIRLAGDVVLGSGARGVKFGGTDITVADSVIEQSGGTGLDLTGAKLVSVNGNWFDDNGLGLNGGPAIEINNTTTASVCNNHISGNGEYSASPAQIHFGGTNDGIVFCGNAYTAETQRGDATLKPSYAYDADPGTVLTNSHLYESPPPHVLGAIDSPNAVPILAPLQVPQIVPQQITGFTLANATSPTAVQMLPGTAADSSSLLDRVIFSA